MNATIKALIAIMIGLGIAVGAVLLAVKEIRFLSTELFDFYVSEVKRLRAELKACYENAASVFELVGVDPQDTLMQIMYKTEEYKDG